MEGIQNRVYLPDVPEFGAVLEYCGVQSGTPSQKGRDACRRHRPSSTEKQVLLWPLKRCFVSAGDFMRLVVRMHHTSNISA